MPELPQRKIGIVTCSGEELPEGTVTRLAALRVLEQLRPRDTVTICLPLFLAGGEGDRAFAKFYPTIAVDGCDKRCAFFGTTKYSSEPAASIVVTGLENKFGLEKPEGLRQLNKAGGHTVDITADEIVKNVDSIIQRAGKRADGKFSQTKSEDQSNATTYATCSCASDIPIQIISVDNQEITIVGLPLIFEKFQEQKKVPSSIITKEIMDMVKIYNRIQPNIESSLETEIEKLYELYYQKDGK